MTKKITASILAVCLIFVCCGCVSDNPINSSGFMFDTAAVITVYSKSDSSAADNTLKYCAEFENILSVTNEQSELYKLNNLQTLDVSEHILKNIQKAEQYSNLCNGSFDITIRPLSALWDFKKSIIPTDSLIENALKSVDYKKIAINGSTVSLNGTQLDLGGIAKGYIADMATEHLKEQGVDKALINLGGNIVAFGKEYNIGIKMPFSNHILAELKIKDKAVSTSGTYERCFINEGKVYHHIIDARTGYPADTGLDSATVIAEKSIDADALSTVCILLGKEQALKLINSIDGVEVILVDTKAKLYVSDGVKQLGENKYTVE